MSVPGEFHVSFRTAGAPPRGSEARRLPADAWQWVFRTVNKSDVANKTAPLPRDRQARQIPARCGRLWGKAFLACRLPLALCLSSRFLGRCVHSPGFFDLIVPVLGTMSTPEPVGRPSKRSEVDVGLPSSTSRGKFQRKKLKTSHEVDVGVPTLTSREKNGVGVPVAVG